MQEKELATRCGFCDRACYPEDAAKVLCEGVCTWGCCSHCALGVAVRTGKDIEVHERDRLTGEPPALEIYQRLPKTNCRACGEKTCMAFALRLWTGDTIHSRCQPIFAGDNQHLRPAFVEICVGLGLLEAEESAVTGQESPKIATAMRP